MNDGTFYPYLYQGDFPTILLKFIYDTHFGNWFPNYISP